MSAVALTQSAKAISTNNNLLRGPQVSLQASGGDGAPYDFSVVPGGVGGTIEGNFTDNVAYYTPPAGVTGVDTIQVLDQSGNPASTTIKVCTPIELVCEIIQSTLGLADDQVYLWDQKINIPNDSRLYVAVSVQSLKPFGNRPTYLADETLGDGLFAVQSVNLQGLITFDILSRGPIARDQKELVLLAISSPYAEQQMNLNSFYIAPITSSFVNLSTIDGAAIPYRYNISTNIQYFTTLTNPVQYFDTFEQVQVTTES